MIKLQPAPCRTAVAIFGNKRTLVTVTLKHLLADTSWDVASCCIVGSLLGSAGKMASEGYGKDTVDQVLLAEVAEAFFGLAVKMEVLPGKSDDLGRFSHCRRV